ncbi:MAG: M23 family metallopeptidase [Chlorobi bacterium]|nr:M23 family metallopeptidase [Chlorobiota bacterium]
MSIFNFENLKKSSFYITPSFPTQDTKRYKISFFELTTYILIFIVIIAALVTLVLTFTPAKQIVLTFEQEKLQLQSERIKDLESKVILLTRELNKIAKIDKRLNYALTLAKTDSLDSTAAIYDSLRKSKGNRIPAGGSIFYVVEKFFESFDEQKKNEVYFIKPIEGIIGKKFAPDKGHIGMDFSVKEGTPVVAAASGTVIFADYTTKNGYVMIIEHANNYLSFYKHCSALLKTARDHVIQGETIALSGNTGINTTGAHLHFEIWKNAKPIDPEKLIIN